MANYAAASALRARLAEGGALIPVVHPPFTDAEWRESIRQRETVDGIVHVMRWAVIVTPTDGIHRHFYLRGAHSEVVQRAHALFPPNETSQVVIEPARLSVGGEFIDRRLNTTLSSPEKL